MSLLKKTNRRGAEGAKNLESPREKSLRSLRLCGEINLFSVKPQIVTNLS